VPCTQQSQAAAAGGQLIHARDLTMTGRCLSFWPPCVQHGHYVPYVAAGLSVL
jgi:hypothetical protein